MRRAGLLVLALLGAGAAWLGSAPPAAAHAAIEETSPANGSVLDVAPAEISLSFTEPPDTSLTSVVLLDDAGTELPTGPIELVPGGNREIVIGLEETLADGVYTVTWRTVSRTDAHPTSGTFTFGVGVEAGAVIPTVPEETSGTETPTVLSVIGRASLYLGLIVLFGAGIAGLLALGPSFTTRGWPLALAWTLAAVGVVAITLAERSTLGVPLGTLLSSETGGTFVRLAVAVALTGIATLGVVLRRGRVGLALLAATAGASMLVRAAGGHAGGSVASVLIQWLHLAGVGAWIGGLVWLALGVRRGLDAAAVRRFSGIAAGGLALVLVSGLLRASDELGGPTWWLHPFENEYRTALVLKLGLVAPLVGLGALNRFRNVRRFERLGSRPLLRTVGGELVLAAGVLGMAGVLTGLPPQGTDATTERPGTLERLVVTGSDFATTTRVRLSIAPGTVGPNTFVAEITDYDTGAPVDARRVTLAFDLPDRPEIGSGMEMRPEEDASWVSEGTALSIWDTWNVTVHVEGSGGSVEIPLRVVPTIPGQTTDISEVRGQPTIYTITFERGPVIEAFVDPGEVGRPNQVHLTAFDPDGNELPLASIELEATPQDGEAFEPELLHLTPGHAVANVDLTAGTWWFALTAETEAGRPLETSFQQTFGEA